MSLSFFKRMDTFMDEYCAKNLFSGILRITHRDEILYQRCAGQENPYIPTDISEESRFNFYSLSKPFCAIGLMKLIDCGKVSMDDHPSRHVPEAAGFDEGVTIAHMLRHTSGMTDFAQHAEYTYLCTSKEKHDMRKLVKELAAYPMRFTPGNGTQYANINFALAALIIENVTGQTYAEYVVNEVLHPLGMESAVVDEPGMEILHRVIGMEIKDDVLVPVGNNTGWMLGGGDLIGTVNDVYRLNHAIKKRMLLSPVMWKEVLAPFPINHFGCGCSVEEWNEKSAFVTTADISVSVHCTFRYQKMIWISSC